MWCACPWTSFFPVRNLCFISFWLLFVVCWCIFMIQCLPQYIQCVFSQNMWFGVTCAELESPWCVCVCVCVCVCMCVCVCVAFNCGASTFLLLVARLRHTTHACKEHDMGYVCFWQNGTEVRFLVCAQIECVIYAFMQTTLLQMHMIVQHLWVSPPGQFRQSCELVVDWGQRVP
jgi:hypothetical protein